MVRKFSSSFGLLLLSLFLVLFLPKTFTCKIREKTALTLSPLHSGIMYLKAGFFPKVATLYSKSRSDQKLIEDLKLKNTLLKKQIEDVKEYLLSEERLERQIKRYEELLTKGEIPKETLRRREDEYLKRLELQMTQIPAKIVFRDPAFWSSHVWINVGKKQNRALGEEIVSVDSPVVIGDAIVGVVEYVGESQSKVTLITDATLTTSVRVVRGSLQNKLLYDELSMLCEKLRFHDELFFSKEEQMNTIAILNELKGNIKQSVHERYLAKGELKGSSSPLWRSRKESLNGVGFNYDFDDVEGLARDLRTGQQLKGDLQDILIKEGDVLVTTGMDGIFPAGFIAGFVTHVDPLEEGGISYTIDAKASCNDLSEITHVSVLKRLKD